MDIKKYIEIPFVIIIVRLSLPSNNETMANNKIKRLQIIDELLSSGTPVSFQDCFD